MKGDRGFYQCCWGLLLHWLVDVEWFVALFPLKTKENIVNNCKWSIFSNTCSGLCNACRGVHFYCRFLFITVLPRPIYWMILKKDLSNMVLISLDAQNQHCILFSKKRYNIETNFHNFQTWISWLQIKETYFNNLPNWLAFGSKLKRKLSYVFAPMYDYTWTS